MRAPRVLLASLAALAAGLITTAIATATDQAAVARGAGLSVTATVSTSAGSPSTRIVVRRLQGGSVVTTRVVRGAWLLPRPVRGGAPEGIAWSGSRVVLRSAGRAGRFLAVPAGRGPAVVHTIPGAARFEYDVLSPDGLRLFLAEYPPDSSLLERIRVYDLGTHVLRRQAVVDKLAGGTSMVGVPVARAVSRSGVTTYTVYEGREYPFVHVLDANAVLSICIDLPVRSDVRRPGRWVVALDERHQRLRATSLRLGKLFIVDLGNPQAAVTVRDA
ncbi:MAG: hypothetical protein U0R50_06890 [Gaiellales bacterium]